MFLAALAGLSGLAFADSRARIVRMSYVEGNVQMDRGAGQGLQQAFLNMSVAEGSKVVSGNDGEAEVQFEDGSAIRLVPNSTIEFTQMGLRSSGAKYTTADLVAGQAYFDIHKKGSDEFTVELGRQTITLDHSAEFRADVDHDRVNIAVLHGEVPVSAAGQTVIVRKDETFSFDPNESNYTVAKNISTGPYDDWNSERHDYMDQYAYSSPYQSYSPYYYGLGDLTYYGNFVTVPGWGPMWQPFFMGPGWNPYMDGAWAWCPGFGYSWVSGYPWGWLPYHYGTWAFVPGWGWLWEPGTVWNAWVPVAPVVNPPAGWRQPIPPRRVVPLVVVGKGPSLFEPRFHAPGSPAMPNKIGEVTLVHPPELGRRGVAQINPQQPSAARSGESLEVLPARPSRVAPSEPVRMAPEPVEPSPHTYPTPRSSPPPRTSRPPEFGRAFGFGEFGGNWFRAAVS
jgi:hypothetical protein